MENAKRAKEGYHEPALASAARTKGRGKRDKPSPSCAEGFS